jgi:sugar O-acyltransferase (sialic acid O-acetyltransferase NeuD family)
MSKDNIVLIGGGGHCHSVIDVIELENKYHIIGIVDKELLTNDSVLGYSVIGCDDDLQEIFKDCKNAIVTVGQIESNAVRLKLYNHLKTIGFNLPVIISPLAYVSKHCSIGEGTVVMHNSLINVNTVVGKNCIINTKALIEHDCIIEDHWHISTASVINGGVVVKANTFFGSNATSRQYIEINGFNKAGSLVK